MAANGSGKQQAINRENLDRAIKEINAAGASVVLVAGDIMENGLESEAREFIERIAPLKADVICVPGNHDIGDKWLRNLRLGPETLKAYERTIGPLYQAREVGDLRVIAIASGLFGSGLPQEEKQRAFLQREFQKAHDRPTILLLHNPPFVDDPDEKGTYWNVEPASRAWLLGLAREAGVTAVISGHMHKLAWRVVDGLPLITAPSVSFAVPEGESPVGWALLNVPTGSSPSANRAELSWEIREFDSNHEAGQVKDDGRQGD